MTTGAGPPREMAVTSSKNCASQAPQDMEMPPTDNVRSLRPLRPFIDHRQIVAMLIPTPPSRFGISRERIASGLSCLLDGSYSARLDLGIVTPPLQGDVGH